MKNIAASSQAVNKAEMNRTMNEDIWMDTEENGAPLLIS